MVNLIAEGRVYRGGAFEPLKEGKPAREKTMAYRILEKHNTSGNMDELKIKFDAMASHDITYVGIVQTARASGMEAFPLPYVLTNCHNSLCAVGGTINEDDHVFGLSAARKYGGIFVPPHQAVIHQYMRERMSGCGYMLLGSDSHTRYGAFGTMGVGEGGPELVKQLCRKTYDIAYPPVIAVYLSGKPQKGVGPQDVALAIIRAVFKNGFVKNKVMEFVGPGIANLTMDFRSGIDVMTTETTCLSSIWETDEQTRGWYKTHGLEERYAKLSPEEGAYYDGVVMVDLDKVRPMIALPFHPSNAYTIEEFKANAQDLLRGVEKEAEGIFGKAEGLPGLVQKVQGGEVYVDQGVVAGCSGGTYENVMTVNAILRGRPIGQGVFNLSVYPASQPQFMALLKSGAAAQLMESGAILRSAFCGPCFGAGDVPANGGLSIRHTTRNFPNREGSKPSGNQMAYVALMDARSIAATALNGGKLTAATDVDYDAPDLSYTYDASIYDNRVYQGWGHAHPEEELVFGPNITDWPEQIALPENLMLEVASAIYDPVTTTDELIPSGETSSYRSNPLGLAEFALSRKDPGYVGRAKVVKALELKRRKGEADGEVKAFLGDAAPENTGIGSLVFALKPGDGSAREQAASCQRVLGGCANIAGEYATKRYRSNVVNWGMLPFILDGASESGIAVGDKIYLPGIREALQGGKDAVQAELIRDGQRSPITLKLPAMTEDERDIILAGCLINYYGQE
ncbi:MULTISPECIES: hydratase [unclassified Clostridium]|uniref:hydratase n=1 Tax=unclassified Clostridium TaxID=2614128 RepID=UPI001106D3CB|nr:MULTISPECIES: hydratase [unclassified Clostridium]